MRTSDAESLVLGELAQARQVLDDFMALPHISAKIVAISKAMADAVLAGNKLIACGNGGSNADAIHFAQELTGRFREDRPAIPAIAITDPAHLTCTANDYGFDQVFSRYLDAIGKEGDVLLAISTSGDSANIIYALDKATELGMISILLTGNDGGDCKGKADFEIIVPHKGYSDRIQEVHIKIIHIFILLIEKYLNNHA